MDTLASYDELPYDSLPLPETQPDFLAAVAHLHGFEAPDPATARILELGCAQGGNLIPLAWRWPQSDCVGIELSRVQAERGAAFVASLGLANVRIAHGDLAALPADLGEFDYIIAHGVLSWVPPAVQDALLDVCRRHLSAHGVAYVSFNVEAGWRTLQPLREALIARTDATRPAPERWRQALAVLDALAQEARDPAVLKEIAYLKTAAPSYVFHEYLADFNAPMRFADFAARLDAHGLRYVGEAGPRHAVVELEDAWGLTAEGMAERWLDAEAALDDAQATRFRRALVARDDASCARPADAHALDRLAYYADLNCDEEIDLESASEQHFVNAAGNTFPVSQPLTKAALMALSAVYPQARRYADVVAAGRDVLQQFGALAEPDEAACRDELFRLVIAQAVMMTVDTEARANVLAEMPCASARAETPCAHALARAQAASPAWVVSGVRHVAIDLDAAGRVLLGLLDGRHTRAELARAMHDLLAGQGIAASLETVDARVAEQLWVFTRQGLLVGD